MKRVITGERDGVGYFAHVGEVEAVSSHGFRMELMWGTDELPFRLPTTADLEEHAGGFFPPPHGVRMTLLHFLPDGAAAEGGALDEIMDGESGMHQTDSVDVGWMISGELGLELESGETVWLYPGDLIVQNGTRHRWLNRTDEPAVAGFLTFGARHHDERPASGR